MLMKLFTSLAGLVGFAIIISCFTAISYSIEWLAVYFGLINSVNLYTVALIAIVLTWLIMRKKKRRGGYVF